MTDAVTAPDRGHGRRWWVFAVLAIAQLMIVLDATIVNIALPSAQQALHFSDANRQWVVTAYALAFGSLLLLGGRIGDLFGPKRVFITGQSGSGSLPGSVVPLRASRCSSPRADCRARSPR